MGKGGQRVGDECFGGPRAHAVALASATRGRAARGDLARRTANAGSAVAAGADAVRRGRLRGRLGPAAAVAWRRSGAGAGATSGLGADAARAARDVVPRRARRARSASGSGVVGNATHDALRID